MPISSNPLSSHLYELRSDIDLRTMPSPSIQDEPSAEESIQAEEPMPCISKYDPSQTATAVPLAISLARCCMEGEGRRCSVTQVIAGDIV